MFSYWFKHKWHTQTMGRKWWTVYIHKVELSCLLFFRDIVPFKGQSTYEVDFVLRIWNVLVEECVLLAKRTGLIHSFEVHFNNSSIGWKSVTDVCQTCSNVFINTRKHTDVNVIKGSGNFLRWIFHS